MSVVVEHATQTDLRGIVRLHRENLPWTLNSRSGNGQVASLYRTLMADPRSVVMVAREQSTVIGSASATSDYHSTSKLAAQKSRPGLLRVVMRTSPAITVPLLHDAWLTHRAIERIQPPFNFLLTWFMDPPTRGRGLGRRMLADLVGALGSTSRPLVVDVSDEARDGHAAYQALGFQEVARAPHTAILELRDPSILGKET